jgi:hypothetical protein
VPETSPMSKPPPDPHPATILSRQYGCEIPPGRKTLRPYSKISLRP